MREGYTPILYANKNRKSEQARKTLRDLEIPFIERSLSGSVIAPRVEVGPIGMDVSQFIQRHRNGTLPTLEDLRKPFGSGKVSLM